MKKVLIAGHTGLVGSALTHRLETQHAGLMPVVLGTKVDYRDPVMTQQIIGEIAPDAIVICAGRVGGIGDNIHRPADYVYDNAMIQTNIIKAAHAHNVSKLIALGSSCIYPRECEQPMIESAFLSGPYEPTNRAYAVAKTLGIEMCRAYRKQYLNNFYAIMPPNLFGANDNFREHQSHVVAALLRKVYEAEDGDTIEIWGDGSPRREFMHVDDLASAIEFCLLNVDAWHCEPHGFINAGSSEDMSIAELAETIIQISGKNLRARFNTDHPSGMPRKMMDSSKMQALGWRNEISLRYGLVATWEWMQEHWHEDFVRK